MAKKLGLIIDILIGIALVFSVGYYIYTSFPKETAPTEIPILKTGYKQALEQEEIGEENITEEEEEGYKSGWGDWGSGPGGGGGESGEGAGTGEIPPETPPETPDEPPPETPDELPETPIATLSLLDFDYEIVDSDTAKVTSLTYGVENSNIASINLELLIYIYDENDDISKKGLVRDQIQIGELRFGESVTDTAGINAFYSGNLAAEKTLKITLMGHISGEGYNLGSVTEDVLFS
ncbi:hypothetical protein KY361_01805 [Candidatus Woesearchaeota archaeon]|nr:hypothetical protein [Candidatus Woesearchaeota archaeon]